MTSLPKRGDRVRVTEAATGLMMVTVGQEFTLANDAREHPQHPGFIAFSPAPSGWVSPVKVEILERAGERECPECRGYKERFSDMRDCPTCKGNGRVSSIHPEFARGMRRAVEIAERLCDPSGQQNSAPTLSLRALKEAVEKELK